MPKTDLTVLIPRETFKTSIGDISLEPFKFKKAREALDLINRLKLIWLTPKTIIVDGVNVEVDKTVNELIEEVLGRYQDGNYQVLEDIISILLLSTKGATKETLEELGYDEISYLLTTIVLLNKDFFGERIKLLMPPEVKLEEPPLQSTGGLESQS